MMTPGVMSALLAAGGFLRKMPALSRTGCRTSRLGDWPLHTSGKLLIPDERRTRYRIWRPPGFAYRTPDNALRTLTLPGTSESLFHCTTAMIRKESLISEYKRARRF